MQLLKLAFELFDSFWKEKLDLDWPIFVIEIKASLCSICCLDLSASLLARNPALTHAASKVLDVIKVIWPCFNHWENWAAPNNPTLEGDKIQSLIREVIDWCNLIEREAVEGMSLIAFVHYICWSWSAIFFTFICYLISVVAKFSSPPHPTGVPLGPVLVLLGPVLIRDQQTSTDLIQEFQNSLSNKKLSIKAAETPNRERNKYQKGHKAYLRSIYLPGFQGYRFPPELTAMLLLDASTFTMKCLFRLRWSNRYPTMD